MSADTPTLAPEEQPIALEPDIPRTVNPISAIIDQQLKDQRDTQADFNKKLTDNQERIKRMQDETADVIANRVKSAQAAANLPVTPEMLELSKLLHANPRLVVPCLQYSKALLTKINVEIDKIVAASIPTPPTT